MENLWLRDSCFFSRFIYFYGANGLMVAWCNLELDWEAIVNHYSSNPISYTKNRKPFRIWRITDESLSIALPAGEQSVSRVNLQKAVDIISNGGIIDGPSDYKSLVADERPAYAWAILRDMGFIR